MSLNRRRHANAMPLASIATWILVAVFVGMTGLYYVYCKNHLHIIGGTIKKLERELEEVMRENEGMRARIASLSSRPALQARLEAGFIKLIPITDDRIIRITEQHQPGDDELRAVANERKNE
jgi:cell division protein FtsB